MKADNPLDRIKIIQLDSGLSKNKFAEKIGWNPGSYYSMFHRKNSGKETTPSFEMIRDILRTYPINARWLILGEGEMYENSAEEQKSLLNEPETSYENKGSSINEKLLDLIKDLREENKELRNELLQTVRLLKVQSSAD